MSPRELMRAYGRAVRMRDRRQRASVEQMKSDQAGGGALVWLFLLTE